MIRILTARSSEQLCKLRSVTGGVSRTMMESGGDGEKRDRSELNKGVDGVSKPSDTSGGSRSLIQQHNTVTGQTEWDWAREDYDYHQEIARSSYADMLHDTERNEKYYAAISKSIQALREQGQRVQVLDIGTGTGLLSMMAAAEGADSITACEEWTLYILTETPNHSGQRIPENPFWAFEPMANCATQVIKENGYSDRIRLIHGRSTDIQVGEGKDMEQKANLLVTEVFDTELIGEGAIGTYTHAHEKLLQENCLTVPRAANMYIQPICSDYIRRWNTLCPIRVASGKSIQIPTAWGQCGGAPSLHDLQLDQISPSLFTRVGPPVKIFRFDFSQRGALKKTDSSEVTVVAEVEGQVDAIFVWWDLEMDPKGKIILSCAPRWAHPLGLNLPWRDHWMQAIFYPSHRLQVKQGEAFRIIGFHDEYSLWFDTALPEQQVSVGNRPVCECGLHVAISRSRLGMLSEEGHNTVFLQALKKHISSTTVCMCISDFSLLPIMAAMLGAKKVFVLDRNKMSAQIFTEIIRENQLEEKIILLEKPAQDIVKEDFQGLQVDLVIGEPFFQTSILPWDSVHYMYALHTLQPLLAPEAAVLPATITVHALAMHFQNLWKIRAPVGLCQGFMLNIFDSMIKNASSIVDQREEPQPLWEYPGVAMSQPISVFSLEAAGQLEPSTSDTASLPLHLTCEVEGEVNGVALWCEYHFGEGQTISTGPLRPPVMGEPVEWNMYSRQAVYLTCSPCAVTPGYTLDFTSQFVPKDGKLKFVWSF